MEEVNEDFSDEEEGESASTVKADDDRKSVEEAPEKEIDASDLEQIIDGDDDSETKSSWVK